MVIERFRAGDPKPVYKRFAARDTWVAEGGARCFQLMDCDSVAQLQPWIDAWADLADFEVVPVTDSAAAARRFND